MGFPKNGAIVSRGIKNMGSLHLQPRCAEPSSRPSSLPSHQIRDLRLFERDLVVSHVCEITVQARCINPACSCMSLFLDFITGTEPLGEFLNTLRPVCEHIRAFADGDRALAGDLLSQHIAEGRWGSLWIASVNDNEAPGRTQTWVSAESRNGLVLSAIGQAHANRQSSVSTSHKAFGAWMRTQNPELAAGRRDSVACPALATKASKAGSPTQDGLRLWVAGTPDGFVTMLFSSDAILDQLAKHVERRASQLGIEGDLSALMHRVPRSVRRQSDAAAIIQAIENGRSYGFTAAERAELLAHCRTMTNDAAGRLDGFFRPRTGPACVAPRRRISAAHGPAPAYCAQQRLQMVRWAA